MSRLVVLATLLAACSSSGSVAQRGPGPRPRMPAWDAHPIAAPRELVFHAEGGATSAGANLARMQGGAEMRLRGGDSWHTAVGIELAPGFLMTRDETLIDPPIGPSLGITTAIRKSFGSGSVRLGVLAGAQGWRVQIKDAIGESAGLVRPAALAGLVVGARTGRIVLVLGASAQAAVIIDDAHPSGAAMRASIGMGAAAELGLRIDVADATWLSLQALAGAHEASASVGGALSLGYALP